VYVALLIALCKNEVTENVYMETVVAVSVHAMITYSVIHLAMTHPSIYDGKTDEGLPRNPTEDSR
jgi:hypothetical protein